MKKITLHDFRCYTSQDIYFGKGVNLLIGDNASGKTSLLKACKYILSSFFSGFTDENTKWISPTVDDFRIEESSSGMILAENPIVIKFSYYQDLFDTLSNISGYEANPAIDGNEYELRKNTKKSSRALSRGITELKYYSKYLYDTLKGGSNQIYALPLFASFATDIHSSRKIDAGKFIKYSQKKSFGYYGCLECEGFFFYWVKRLLILQEGNKNLDEVAIVRKAIQEALGADGCNIITDIDIRHNRGKVYFILVDGREVETAYLSDGYRRLVSIVLDLAFRCALLNREKYGENATKETNGIVLIDEIDLHLHPILQSLVVKSLQNTFPRLQFIITTHAPLIMSGIENNDTNIVYKLDYSQGNGYTVQEISTYGMDVSTITEVVLSQVPRDVHVDKQLRNLFDLIDNDQLEEAKKAFDLLKFTFGDRLPDLAQAEAMLNFSLLNDD